MEEKSISSVASDSILYIFSESDPPTFPLERSFGYTVLIQNLE